MNYIGLIDEDRAARKMYERDIQNYLDENNLDWSIIAIPPFETIPEYISWINEEEIKVLVIDEKLDHHALKNGNYADHLGSTLAEALSNHFKDFPIFSLTAHPEDAELRSSYKFFYEILSKNKWDEIRDEKVNLMVKSGEKFYSDHLEQLEKIGDLSYRVARNKATTKQKKELARLQTSLAIPYYGGLISDRADYLKKKEQELKELEQLKKQLKSMISKKKK